MAEVDNNDASLEAYERRQEPKGRSRFWATLYVIAFLAFFAGCSYAGYKIITEPCKACQIEHHEQVIRAKRLEEKLKERENYAELYTFPNESRSEEKELEREIERLTGEGTHVRISPYPAPHPALP